MRGENAKCVTEIYHQNTAVGEGGDCCRGGGRQLTGKGKETAVTEATAVGGGDCCRREGEDRCWGRILLSGRGICHML